MVVLGDQRCVTALGHSPEQPRVGEVSTLTVQDKDARKRQVSSKKPNTNQGTKLVSSFLIFAAFEATAILVINCNSTATHSGKATRATGGLRKFCSLRHRLLLFQSY